jgi:hypothetical protein
LEELEELEQEDLARELLNVGNKEEESPVNLPSVPSTHLPAEPGIQTCHLKNLKGWECWGKIIP